MEFPTKFDTVKTGWLIIYTEGSQIIISKTCNIFFCEDKCCLINPDKMQYSKTCLKQPLKNRQTKVLKTNCSLKALSHYNV